MCICGSVALHRRDWGNCLHRSTLSNRHRQTYPQKATGSPKRPGQQPIRVNPQGRNEIINPLSPLALSNAVSMSIHPCGTAEPAHCGQLEIGVRCLYLGCVGSTWVGCHSTGVGQNAQLDSQKFYAYTP